MNPFSGPPHNSNIPLTRLVDACLHGDGAAWNELIRRYARLVHSVPVQYGLAPMEVDDIGQEVFMILAQNLHQIEDPERLPSWLLTTARRTTWRLIQKRRRERPTDTAELMDGSESGLTTAGANETSLTILGTVAPSMHELLEEWNHQEALNMGLEQLDGRCRELLQLLFLDHDEPSYDEISRQLQMPPGSIGPTRNRCLRKLRTILENLGYTDVF